MAQSCTSEGGPASISGAPSTDDVMSYNYSDKLTHVQVVINRRYFVAQLCTSEDGLAYISGMQSIDDFYEL